MAKFVLDFQTEIDVLTQRELDESLTRQQALAMDWVRGLKWMRRLTRLPTTPTSAVLAGPDQGFAWDVKMISGVLTGSDSVAVYLGEQAGDRPVGYAPAPGAAPAQDVFVITFSSHQLLLQPGESLFAATSGAFRFTSVLISAVQVPAEMIGKVLA